MLIDRVEALMRERGIKTRAECERLCGLSNGMLGKWATQNTASGTSLEKVANYFSVSVDFLLEKTDDPRGMVDAIDPSDIRWAMYNSAKDLSDEDVQEMLEIIKLKKRMKKEK